MKKVLTLVLCIMLVLGISLQAVPAATASTTKLKPVTLKIVQPGDKSPIFDQTKAEIEKGCASLNVKLNVVFVPWADLADKTKLMLASGDPVDLIFDAPWLHMNQMIAAGYYQDIGSLLNQYGKTILSTRPQQMWDANKFNGKIMGVPLGLYMTQPHTWIIRKDIREKLKMAPITTYDQLMKYAYAAKKLYPKMVAFSPSVNSNITCSYAPWKLLDDDVTNVRYTQVFGSSLMLYYKNNDGKIYNMFEDKTPAIDNALAEARKLINDGMMDKDMLFKKGTNNPMLDTGNVLVSQERLFNPLRDPGRIANLKKLNGGEVEAVTLMTKQPGKVASFFNMDNFICLTSISKNKERAIQWLDWANQKDNYQIIEHGIKGKDWAPVGTDRMKNITGNEFAWQAYSIVWNPKDELYAATDDDNSVARQKLIADGNWFVKDVTTGFSFDATPVKNEIAQYTAIEGKYYPLIMNGLVDTKDGMAKFKAEAGTLLKKIQVEAQKQVDAYLKK